MSYLKKVKQLEEVRSKLLSEERTRFRLKGGPEDRIYEIDTVNVSDDYSFQSVSLVTNSSLTYKSMNVYKITPTQIKLYDYDMFDDQVMKTIKIEDIILI